MWGKRIATVAAFSVVLFGSTEAAQECTLTGTSVCLLEGKLFAKAVDETRFLIAVDLHTASEPSNGHVDHLSLFSQNSTTSAFARRNRKTVPPFMPVNSEAFETEAEATLVEALRTPGSAPC